MDPSSQLNNSERRKHARMDLRVPARLYHDLDVIHLTTQNVSIGGFYTICDKPFACGQQFDSVLEIAGLFQSSRSGAHLECRVRVVRVEVAQRDCDDESPMRFGIAFCIESYHVATSNDKISR